MPELPEMPRMNDPLLPNGFRAAAVQCGIRPKRKRLDLGLVLADHARPCAAMYTKNLLLGAHVPVCREHLARSGGAVRAILVNSGNANCSTGAEGIEDNRRVCRALAELLGCPPEEVLFLSTGVIGARLPIDRVLEALPELVGRDSQQGLDAFSQAIMTTDLVPKVVARDCADARGQRFRVTGVAKGSGMIHPDMATMFGFLLTDAGLGGGPGEARGVLRRVCDRSFHRLSVDGDTSPNDTVVLWSSSAVPTAQPDVLAADLEDVAQELCRKIAVDGEGATRLVTIEVRGAPSEGDAVRVGRTIATSPLTKTAIHGRDPNWGRIVAAAGRSGVGFDPLRARVWIGGADVYSAGRPHPENENAAHLHMLNEKEVQIGIDLAAGPASAAVWTCDFSADYVRINADYRS
jgi:glutamate N-acetyltransferase/amino-acid N-acetyltransferase